MADSEKLTALKKAYADIILNTAKEAAARIMVSERKALRYKQELLTAKDEALRMLVRLKQMLDSKVSEAETTSLNQQKRIEELEAQLGEAEDIVKDLRAELREAQDELEKMTKNQRRFLDEQKSKDDIVSSLETSHGNRINNGVPLISVTPAAPTDSVAVSDVKNPVLNGKYSSNKCACNENCYACNPDFASIVMRRKEPDLYRNGCTQRIRALERCLSNGNLPLSGQVKDVNDEILIRKDEEGKDICTKLALRVDNTCRPMENPDELNKRADKNFIQVLAVNSFCTKRKRAARYKRSNAPESKNSTDQVMEACKEADILSPETSCYAVDNHTQLGNYSREFENNAQKGPQFPLHSDTTEVVTQSRSEDVTKDDLEFVDDKMNNKSSADKELMRQDSGAEKAEIPSCKMDLEIVDVSLVKTDTKSSGITEGAPLNNKFLKYTFRRKRKKDSMTSPDRDSSLDDALSQRKTEEKENASRESQKSILITESSRDNRRLAQVARQLISLSEKKWRQ